MKHTITINAQEFSQSIKDASCYAFKDFDTDEALSHVLLTIIPKVKKLSVIACDKHGYYERRLQMIQGKGQPKPSLPDNKLCISLADAATIIKLIPGRILGNVTIEIDDSETFDNKFIVRLFLPNGASSTFQSKMDLNIPDYANIRAQAEKGKKQAPKLSDVHMPVNEMLRAGKVFTGKAPTARMFTSSNVSGGAMVFLECLEDNRDIRVIFMLANMVADAA